MFIYRLAAWLACLAAAAAIGRGVGPLSAVCFYEPELPPELREE